MKTLLLSAAVFEVIAFPALATERTYYDTNGNTLTGLRCSVLVDEQGNEVHPGAAHCSNDAGKSLICKQNPFDVMDPNPKSVLYSCGAYLDGTGQPTDNPFAGMPTPAAKGDQSADYKPPTPEERAANVAADHAKAMRECDNKPTWLGVLFCRWDQ